MRCERTGAERASFRSAGAPHPGPVDYRGFPPSFSPAGREGESPPSGGSPPAGPEPAGLTVSGAASRSRSPARALPGMAAAVLLAAAGPFALPAHVQAEAQSDRSLVPSGLGAGHSVRLPSASTTNRTSGAGPSAEGPRASGPHAGGLRHGLWRIVHPDGSVEEGRYVRGRLHGRWVLRGPSGAVVACETWRHGRAVASQTVDCEGAAEGPGEGEAR